MTTANKILRNFIHFLTLTSKLLIINSILRQRKVNVFTVNFTIA